MLKVFAWIFTLLGAVLVAVGALIIYVTDTDSSFPFGAGIMVMAALVFGVIGCVLWGVEITKTNRDRK
ncbi:hypothetical protein [Varibaculum vaginae]|uniref:hypothetical protein n=1 Tax=Varibaculum vaginae TaxID=2364797 RepID=UPI000F0780ED|nr:hypothetical protein [Varibaculum vaginae]